MRILSHPKIMQCLTYEEEVNGVFQGEVHLWDKVAIEHSFQPIATKVALKSSTTSVILFDHPTHSVKPKCNAHIETIINYAMHLLQGKWWISKVFEHCICTTFFQSAMCKGIVRFLSRPARMISDSLELETQRENESMKGVHARFEPGTLKSLQGI